MLIRDGEQLDPAAGLFETCEVAALVNVASSTLNSWRIRYGLFGGSQGSTTARYLLSIQDACAANLMAGLTWHGLPAADAAKIASKQTSAMSALFRGKDAPSVLIFYRDGQARTIAKVVTADMAASRAAISTHVDLRQIVRDLTDPYDIEISDG